MRRFFEGTREGSGLESVMQNIQGGTVNWSHKARTAMLVSLGALLMLMLGCVSVAQAYVNYDSVTFLDAQHGWAAGLDESSERNVLMETSNGGASWKRVARREPANAGESLVAFASRRVGVWDAGGFVWTADGGGSWRPVTFIGQVAYITSVAFASSHVGWLCSTDDPGDGFLLKTTNGGARWHEQLTVSSPQGGFTDVSCPSTTCCYVLRRGDSTGINDALWATTNGGNRWSRQTLPRMSGGSWINDIAFPHVSTGWVIGAAGRIEKTTNGGRSWQTQRSGASAPLLSISFTNADDGWIVGEEGVILHTRDGGRHWTHQNSGTAANLWSVSFADRLHGCAAGDHGVLLCTSDGGRTWR